MKQRSYYGRIANNIQRAYYFKEQFISKNWYYFDFRSFITDFKTFRKTWKKFVDNFFRQTGIRLFGVIEHQSRSPWNFHVHAIAILHDELNNKLKNAISSEWIKAGGSSFLPKPPREDDPFCKLRYILKASYGNRSSGRKTKPKEMCVNHHVSTNLDPLPWKGQMLPTNHISHTKLKALVDDYFSKEKKTFPTSIRSII